MKAIFIWSCVDNPFKDLITLSYVIDNGKEINKRNFLNKCDVSIKLKKDMKEYQNDYRYYNQDWIYFFTHSAIEYFYTNIKYYIDKNF